MTAPLMPAPPQFQYTTLPHQTAAVQSTNQLLAVLAEDMAALRTLMLAQSRLLAEAVCRHWDTRPVQLLVKVQVL